MDDHTIIELYWARAEDAIQETAAKYGRLCRVIVGNILLNPDDSEECVNYTYWGLWNAMPPHRPHRLAVFIGRVARNLALKKFDYLTAAKRNPTALCSLEELGDCVSGRTAPESELENRRIEEAITGFLQQQREEQRNVFLLRYWYFESIDSICRRTGFGKSKIKSMLRRTRQKLREHLEQEEIEL